MKDLNVFLQEMFPAINFNEEAKLIDDGLIDSLDLFRLVSALQEEYKITIPFDDISFENFNSIQAILALIEKLIAGEKQ